MCIISDPLGGHVLTGIGKQHTVLFAVSIISWMFWLT